MLAHIEIKIALAYAVRNTDIVNRLSVSAVAINSAKDKCALRAKARKDNFLIQHSTPAMNECGFRCDIPPVCAGLIPHFITKAGVTL